MALTATPTAAGLGLSKGTAYPVLGYTGSTVLILDDYNRLQHISYTALENEDLWALSDDEAKAKKSQPEAGYKPSTGGVTTSGVAVANPIPRHASNLTAETSSVE